MLLRQETSLSSVIYVVRRRKLQNVLRHYSDFAVATWIMQILSKINFVDELKYANQNYHLVFKTIFAHIQSISITSRFISCCVVNKRNIF